MLIRHSNSARGNDLYETPEVATLGLLVREPLSPTIWEIEADALRMPEGLQSATSISQSENKCRLCRRIEGTRRDGAAANGRKNLRGSAARHQGSERAEGPDE